MKTGPPSGHRAHVTNIFPRSLLRITSGLIIIWLIAVWWGERGVFNSAIRQCAWESWERWPTEAQPHHALLIADPQLVDPHTYPGRPWPLSSLTIYYTDLYLRRAYYGLQHSLQPDSTLFLGDLFDGGREWGTGKYSSPEEQYKGYGAAFWLKEYQRFSNLFIRDWNKGQPIASSTAAHGRHILASVPGNHDLGFASGINPQVKARFDAYFGPMNRVDVLGNHSFVSLDTVSLSAMDEVDPKTGAHGAGDGSAAATATSHLWRPVEDFLNAAKSLRHRAVQREWSRLRGSVTKSVFRPELKGLGGQPSKAEISQVMEIPSSQFPSLILSHVPLFRPADTSCGPLREGRPAISLSAGYQYQNVLTPLISSDIIKHLTPEEIVGIYSGDDHDYCEIQHTEYTGAVKEITVKSMSWAMGIRKPGVQLLSLWNPIDLEKVQQQAINNPGDTQPTPKDTVQNQLCLLPDQLTIFIRYGLLFLLTLAILAINAFFHSSCSPDSSSRNSYSGKSEPLLPLSHPSTTAAMAEEEEEDLTNGQAAVAATTPYKHTPTPSSFDATAAIGDPFAPAPHSHVATTLAFPESDDWGRPIITTNTIRRKRATKGMVFAWSLWEVAWPVLGWYAWLLWRDRARS